jgi:hypothetical protein
MAMAVCGSVAALGQGPGVPPGLPPPVAAWPARDAARLADPGQSLGARSEQATEPAALVPPVAAPPSASTGPRWLDDCVAIALQNHPRITAARAEIRAAQGRAVQARLYPNPVIAGFTPQAAGSDSQWSGTVAQDIVTAGKLRLQEQAALREVPSTRRHTVSPARPLHCSHPPPSLPQGQKFCLAVKEMLHREKSEFQVGGPGGVGPQPPPPRHHHRRVLHPHHHPQPQGSPQKLRQ